MMAAIDKGTLRGELRHDEPMARHISWRVGGPARTWYRPADIDDLVVFLSSLPSDEEIHWVGLGSNLLVRDAGISGTVIAPFDALNSIDLMDATTLRSEVGVACAKVARFSAARGLTDGEFLAGIPGTLGGALAMNAGAFGGETWRLVQAVETLDRSGTRHVRTPEEYDIGYRHVTGPAEEWFVAAQLGFSSGDAMRAQAHIRDLLARRAATQPTQQFSCGSVFRNPAGDHAARLIEACGLKGTCVGAACVSDKHANFIVNNGDASAANIEALINQIRNEVERVHGVQLVPEVRIVGESKDS